MAEAIEQGADLHEQRLGHTSSERPACSAWSSGTGLDEEAVTLLNGMRPFSGTVTSATSAVGSRGNDASNSSVASHAAGTFTVVGLPNENRVVVLLLPAPQLAVLGNRQLIVSGSDTPERSNGTDFGTRRLGSSFSMTFTIRNTGSAPLSLTTPAITIPGPAPEDFSLVASPSESPPVGGSTSFTLKFSPSVIGPQRAVIQITSDDPTRALFFFAVGGSGLPNGVYLPLVYRYSSGSLLCRRGGPIEHAAQEPGRLFRRDVEAGVADDPLGRPVAGQLAGA